MTVEIKRIVCALLVVAAIASGGCRRGGAKGGLIEREEERLGRLGLQLEGFADADAHPLSASRCRAGTIDRVAAVLCEYGGEDALLQGRKAAEQWIGSAMSGAEVARDRLLLIVADRQRTDANGKSIHRITHMFKSGDSAK